MRSTGRYHNAPVMRRPNQAGDAPPSREAKQARVRARVRATLTRTLAFVSITPVASLTSVASVASGASVAFCAGAGLVACGGDHNDLGATPPPRPTTTPLDPELAAALTSPSSSSTSGSAPSASGSRASSSSACPDDMAYVDTTYCPKVRLNCLKDEYNAANHITICHKFAPGQVCEGTPRRQRFCIDKYEYPNKKGDHPPVMVDWYDAAGLCAAKGKRLCWESEWVSACEGPEKLPFPYGLTREPSKCNIDNRWLNVDLKKLYSHEPGVQDAALAWLDQSVASGFKEGCVSGFGVHDLTGNVDEWVIAEATYEKSKWAGLKGGAWGHVRNACRPMTTSHPPEFTYYFVSFRCCADAAQDAAVTRDPSLWKPPKLPSPPNPKGSVFSGWTPRVKGPNQPM